MIDDGYKIVNDFEQTIANLAGSKFAVAVDCCTNALFLSLKYIQTPEIPVTIPKHTYVGVVGSIRNAGHLVYFEDLEWSGTYQLKPFPVYDGALRFQKNMYKGGFHCLSFHIKKHLKIGRGGMILTDDAKAYEWFKLARFNGRNPLPHKLDKFKMIGWNYYMTSSEAARGLWLLSGFDEDTLLQDLPVNYPDLSVYDFNSYVPGQLFSE
jgi:dTDP-4-amino-4,6-dideoxygalactose transaminase